jgi:ABC-type transport system involved in multi-copper enzyme maturation permease subunit
MVWIALMLLGFTLFVVALNTAGHRWGKDHWRSPRGRGPSYQRWLDAATLDGRTAATSPPAAAVSTAVLGAWRVALDGSGFHVFSSWLVFPVFLSFLLPIWSLSFATTALGGEREAGSLLWLVTRPIPRPAIYLAQYLALLPWSLGLNLGGFGLLCLAAGWPGALAFQLYWPAVLWATLAFCALFHLFAACFRRPAVVGIVYVFFLETILGNMPGTMKRISINYYTRCLMFDAASAYGVQPDKPSIYLPVSGTIAWWVLVGGTLALLAAGMIVFARAQYREES